MNIEQVCKSLEGIKVVHTGIKAKGTGYIINVNDRGIAEICFYDTGEHCRFSVNRDKNYQLQVSEEESIEHKELYRRATAMFSRIRHEEDLKDIIHLIQSKYPFEGFVHYTAYENFKEIYQYGHLLSRNEIVKRGAKIIDLAEEAVLEKTPEEVQDMVRLSYGFNTPISYRFEQHIKRMNGSLVAMVFSPKLVFDYDVLFYGKSAARLEYGKPIRDFNVIRAFNWDKILERGPMESHSKGADKQYRDAEVTVDGELSLEYLNAVYFRDEECLTRARREIGYDNRFHLGQIDEFKHFSPEI